jgi:hypothetical protein
MRQTESIIFEPAELGKENKTEKRLMMLHSGRWKLRLKLAPFSAGKQTLLRMSPIISVFSLFVVRCALRFLKKSEAISDLAHARSK